MKRLTTATVVVVFASIGVVHADSPLPPPAVHRASSPNGKFEVVSDPNNGTKLIESGSGKQLCESPGWFRSVYVSNDGEHFATGYSGLNLVPLNAADSLELIGFWKRCRKFESVPLRAIVPEQSMLQHTVSHYAWGNITGVDPGGRLVVTRIDGRVFRFNMASGKTE